MANISRDDFFSHLVFHKFLVGYYRSRDRQVFGTLLNLEVYVKYFLEIMQQYLQNITLQ